MSENVAELLAEIERLRARIFDLEAERETRRQFLHERINRAEGELAIMLGSLAPHPADDEPGNYTHDIAPSAPR